MSRQVTSKHGPGTSGLFGTIGCEVDNVGAEIGSIPFRKLGIDISVKPHSLQKAAKQFRYYDNTNLLT